MATSTNSFFPGVISMLLIFTFAACLDESSSSPKQIPQEELIRLATANNYFALNLHRKLSSGSSQNVFFSPLSLSSVLGMLRYGTTGPTSEELTKVLGYNTGELSDNLVPRDYLNALLPSKTSSQYILNFASSLVVDKDMQLIPSYEKVVRTLFNASVHSEDLKNNGAKAVLKVNAWVKTETYGKIDRLVDHLDPETIMVLLNAVYFKGFWKTKFNAKNTESQTFYNGGQVEQEISMMHMESEVPYAKGDGYQAIELPYQGEDISMIVLLPDSRDGLPGLEESLTPEMLSTIRNKLRNKNVVISLPKFKVEYSRELSDSIKALGAVKIFSYGADFSRMTSSNKVLLNQIVHRAVVEVNEEGSEAAAATALSFTYSATTGAKFTVDHPFLFVIADKRNGLIIFMGRVNIM